MMSNEIIEIGKKPKLQKSLKSRHVTMISLGGTIGTGLFLASGGAIADRKSTRLNSSH